MIDADEIVRIMVSGEALKMLERSGWILADVSAERRESVAEHSYGVILTSLLIAQCMLKERREINLEKILIMATIHDIQESITGDIPRTLENEQNRRFMEQKAKLEQDAIYKILGGPNRQYSSLYKLWMEYCDVKSIESRIVRGADVLDMILHARKLESDAQQSQKLEQFFQSGKNVVEQLNVQVITEIFNILSKNRQGTSVTTSDKKK